MARPATTSRLNSPSASLRMSEAACSISSGSIRAIDGCGSAVVACPTGMSRDCRWISAISKRARRRRPRARLVIGGWSTPLRWAFGNLDETGRTLFANDRLAALFGGVAPDNLHGSGVIRYGAVGTIVRSASWQGVESKAVIPSRAGRTGNSCAGRRLRLGALPKAPGLQAADQRRTAVLTLIDVTALNAAQARAEYLAWHDVSDRFAEPCRVRSGAGHADDRGCRAWPPCCSWISTGSRSSTTSMVTRRATRCCARWRPGCEARFDPVISHAGSGATSLRSCSRVRTRFGHVAETAARLSWALRRSLLVDGVRVADFGQHRIGALSDRCRHGGRPEARRRLGALYRVKHEGRGGIAEPMCRRLGEAVERRLLLAGGARPGD